MNVQMNAQHERSNERATWTFKWTFKWTCRKNGRSQSSCDPHWSLFIIFGNTMCWTVLRQFWKHPFRKKINVATQESDHMSDGALFLTLLDSRPSLLARSVDRLLAVRLSASAGKFSNLLEIDFLRVLIYLSLSEVIFSYVSGTVRWARVTKGDRLGSIPGRLEKRYLRLVQPRARRGWCKEEIHARCCHLSTLHCIVIGLTRERFVVLRLLSWTHLRTRYWGVFTLQGLKRFSSWAWPMALRKLGNRWKGESWFHYTKVLFVGVVGNAEMWFYLV